jgi:hypothetical protein
VTDYLTQLVLRARQPDLAIQPRLASRFESPRQPAVEVPGLAPSSEPDTPEWPDPIDVSPVPASAPVDHRPKRHRRHDAVDVTIPSGGESEGAETEATAPVAKPRVGTRSARKRADAQPPAGDAQDPLRVPPVTQIAGHTRNGDLPVPPREGVPSGQPASVVVPPRRTASHTDSDRPTGRWPTREPDRPPVRDRIATESVRHAERPRPETTSPAPQPRERVARLEAAFTPQVSRPIAAPDIERPAVPESPTIHVTIGRVEIRAAVPAPAVRKAQSRPPGMSLEQYLKQRRGAARE